MKKLLLILLVISTNCFGDDREQKIQRLMEAQGILAMFEQQLTMSRQQGREQADRMLEQILTNLNPNKDFQNRFRAASEKFISALETPWSAKEIVSVWAQYFGAKFSDAELDELLKFYQSDLGKKEVIASKEALVDFSKHFAEAKKPIIDAALKQYIQDSQRIAKECNCKRPKKPAPVQSKQPNT